MDIICDLDGTLTDCRWRLHWAKSKNWEVFHAGIPNDNAVNSILILIQELQSNDDNSIIFVTGRPEKYKNTTCQWLMKFDLDCSNLFMRKDNDFRPDYVVKLELLEEVIQKGFQPTLAIEDKFEVAEAYRKAGLTVLAPRFYELRGWGTTPFSASLSLLIGPSGAGKTSWIQGRVSGPNDETAFDFGLLPRHVISTDDIRADLMGDFKDQTRNDEVFDIFHDLIRQRLEFGLPVVVDATNLRRQDRLKIVNLAPYSKLRYFVLNRSVGAKRETGGWRNELSFDLIAKHEATFQSQLPDILKGDDIPGIEVIDLRHSKS